MAPADVMKEKLSFIYGPEVGQVAWAKLEPMLAQFKLLHPQLCSQPKPANERVSESDAVLITYGDSIREETKAPLKTLDEVITKHAGDVLSGIHILPHYPWTSDDGFSVVDYKAVDPALGTWGHLEDMSKRYKLMYDAVINHCSQESEWFKGFLRGERKYQKYFTVAVPSDERLKDVVRPRTHFVLTPFETSEGTKHVWTTFSTDQIDLNYADPDLMLEVVEILLTYAHHGASLLRLDAIGFMWKDLGTGCMHLPQVHAIIQCIRAVFDEVFPDMLLVTETNVPHKDNISYFGNGYNEAQMVYNFTLPPLTFFSFVQGDATRLSEWASTLKLPSDQTCFFNFMASHDGIGVRPVEGILSRDELNVLVKRVQAHGGKVNFRTLPDGSQSPYELNIVYFSALSNPKTEPADLCVQRFLASQSILVAFPGVPGIYIHSLFGSQNWEEGVELTGMNRTINRRKFVRSELEADLADADSIPHKVFDGYKHLLRTRRGEKAFHPNGAMEVINTGPYAPSLLCFVRNAPDNSSKVLCVVNVANATVDVDLSSAGFGAATNLLDNQEHDTASLSVPPYGIMWLK